MSAQDSFRLLYICAAVNFRAVVGAAQMYAQDSFRLLHICAAVNFTLLQMLHRCLLRIASDCFISVQLSAQAVIGAAQMSAQDNFRLLSICAAFSSGCCRCCADVYLGQLQIALYLCSFQLRLLQVLLKCLLRIASDGFISVVCSSQLQDCQMLHRCLLRIASDCFISVQLSVQAVAGAAQISAQDSFRVLYVCAAVNFTLLQVLHRCLRRIASGCLYMRSCKLQAVVGAAQMSAQDSFRLLYICAAVNFTLLQMLHRCVLRTASYCFVSVQLSTSGYCKCCTNVCLGQHQIALYLCSCQLQAIVSAAQMSAQDSFRLRYICAAFNFRAGIGAAQVSAQDTFRLLYICAAVSSGCCRCCTDVCLGQLQIALYLCNCQLRLLQCCRC